MSLPKAILTFVRYIWASPTTLIGLFLVGSGLISGGRCQVVRGVLEAHGGFVTMILRRLVPLKNGASAMTLGHVVIGRDLGALARTREHERVHVRQCERWGPLFIPAYFTASLVAKLRGRDAYYGNAFEVEAHQVSNGGDDERASRNS